MNWIRAAAWVCGLAIFLMVARPADGGLLFVDVTPVGTPPADGPPTLAWELLPEEAGTAMLVLEELFGPAQGEAFAVEVSGATDSASTINITKDVENATGVAWIGYLIDLDSDGVATFTGTPSSDTLTLTGQSSHNLTFSLPSEVPHGAMVSFSFDVSIPSTGPFAFTLTQTPILIPEPASAALLGIALMASAARRRRR